MNGATIVLRKVSVVSYFFFKEGENAHTNFAVLILFCPEFKNGVWGWGWGSLLLVKALLEIMSLIELGVAKLFPVCLSLGWAFVFKCALGNKTELECECFCVLFAIQKPTGHLVD